MKKKEMTLLKDKEITLYERQKVCHIWKEKFCDDKNKKMNMLFIIKTDYFHYTRKFKGAAHNICNLRNKVPKKIPVVFHNDSTYDYHFRIKKSA